MHKITKAGTDNSCVEMFNVSYIPRKVGTWVIDIDDAISSPAQFRDAIQVLEMADEDNPVQVNLQCYGGSIDAADTFIHAMKKCEASIHVIATGGVHSAGTLILLQADTFELSSGFNSLIHNGSLGTGGNLNEYVSKSKFDSEFLPRIIREYYEGFLTEDEIQGVIRGDNIWLDAQQWMNRCNNRNQYFIAKELEKNAPPKKSRSKKTKVESIS
jgi:ATP-dependent protease ClpP protease subunit